MKTYEAILIDSNVSHGRESGTLTILDNCIQFKSDENRFEIPYHALVITSGGAGNRLVFFAHKDKPQVSVYTSDAKVLKEEALTRQSQLSGQLKSSRRILRKIKYATLFVLLFFGLLIAGLYLSKDYLVRKIAEQVPVSWEKKAGDQLFTALSSQYKIVENDSLKKVFLEVAEPLLKQVRKKGVHVDLYFVEDPAINAFALPGGKVVIQSGLLNNAESWEQVLGVLGHELAHVTERHHMRGIISNMGLYAIIAASVGDLSAIAGTVANLGGDLASLANSRKMETEADETGWKYLVDAHIDPQGMIAFFEILDRKHKASAKEGYLSFLSSHPATGERIQHLKEKYKKNPQHFAAIQNDYKSFKTAFNQYP